MSEIKEKKCKICKKFFEPSKTTQSVCSYYCALKKVEIDKKNKVDEWKKKKKILDESLRTRQFYVRKLQELVNKFVRLRDEGRSCVSCSEILDSSRNKFDAGHYFSAGHYPELRFNLNNIFGQCVQCNRYKGGNLIEYRTEIIKRIGEEAYQELSDLRNEKSDLSRNDIKELIVNYKVLIKKKENEIRDDNN